MTHTSRICVLFCLIYLVGLTGCGSTNSLQPTVVKPSGVVSLALTPSSISLPLNNSTASVSAILSGDNSASLVLSVSGVPTGATALIAQPSTSSGGTISFDSGSADPGSYSLIAQASDPTGKVAASVTFQVIFGDVISILPTTTGQNNLRMSTSAEIGWRNISYSSDEQKKLVALAPSNFRLQAVQQAIPQRSAGSWNFSNLDAATQPVLAVGDHSPEMQIAFAPAFMYDSNGALFDTTYSQVAEYAQNLVAYFNKGGFTVNSTHYASSSPYPITWWGIFNENNYGSAKMTGAQYAALYDKVVPAMQSVDPSLHFVATEMGVSSSLNSTYLTGFVQQVSSQVDALGVHFYSSSNQSDSDAKVFGTIPTFVTNLKAIRTILASKSNLADTPIWVTENNVNADHVNSTTGMSSIHPTLPFVLDQRGSSAFFAAWRPYLYSQFAIQGVRRLHSFEFEGDAQFGEMDRGGAYHLGYWVDQALKQELNAESAPTILTSSSTDSADVEVFPIRHADGHVTIMIVNHRVAASSDNNGNGALVQALVDFSALGSFTRGTLLMIDANTDVAFGPTQATISATSPVYVSFSGYGVAFLDLY